MTPVREEASLGLWEGPGRGLLANHSKWEEGSDPGSALLSPAPQLLLLVLKAARPLAADPFPSLTNAHGSFPTEKGNHAKGPRLPFQHERAASIPSRRRRKTRPEKRGWRSGSHLASLYACTGDIASPLSPQQKQQRKAVVATPARIRELSEGGHASAQQGARGPPSRPGPRAPPSRPPAAGPAGSGCLLTFCRVTRINTAPASESCRRRFP